MARVRLHFGVSPPPVLRLFKPAGDRSDGVCTNGYNWVRKKIAAFSPKKLPISDEQRKAVCPTATFLLDRNSPTALSIERSGTIFRVNEAKYCRKHWNNAKVR
jgi:hypothetical protein